MLLPVFLPTKLQGNRRVHGDHFKCLISQPDSVSVAMSRTLFIISFMSFAADCADQLPMIPLYVMKGKTVHLSLEQQLSEIKWRRNTTLIATLQNHNQEIRVPGKYDLGNFNGSLTIRNVTEEDGGFYQAQHGQWEENVIQYHLIIQEAVSDPVISTSLLQLNLSSDVCHVLVNCSADGDTAMYNCDLKKCNKISLARVNITVSATGDGMVECVASNHVSTKMTSSPLNIRCSKKNIEKDPAASDFILALITVLVCLMMLGVLGSYLFIKCHNSRKKRKVGNIPSDSAISTVSSVIQTRGVNPSATCQTRTVYDVPSRCVRAFEGTSGQMQERPLEEQTSAANSEVQEKSEDKQLTVYWTLGQKF